MNTQPSLLTSCGSPILNTQLPFQGLRYMLQLTPSHLRSNWQNKGKGEVKGMPLLFKGGNRRYTYHFNSHPTVQNFATQPCLATREAGKCPLQLQLCGLLKLRDSTTNEEGDNIHWGRSVDPSHIHSLIFTTATALLNIYLFFSCECTLNGF